MKKIKFSLFFVCLFYAFSCSSDDGGTSAEEEVNPFVGNFRGTWSSVTSGNTYDRIPASIKITTDPNDSTKLTGEFYWTTSFTSCCQSGPNDGTVQMTVRENEVSTFVLRSAVPNCSGTFNGNGILEGSTITIDFDGGDCEGPHSGGQLIFNL